MSRFWMDKCGKIEGEDILVLSYVSFIYFFLNYDFKVVKCETIEKNNNIVIISHIKFILKNKVWK